MSPRASSLRPSLGPRQDPALAADEAWAHPIAEVEPGCLLVATPDCHSILGNEVYWQAVMLVTHSGPDGVLAFMLNRPTQSRLGETVEVRVAGGSLGAGILGLLGASC